MLSRGGISLHRSNAGPAAAYWFEPNQYAAFPSVHVAATVLVLLATRTRRRWVTVLALLYALAMSFAVVYLGEHYVLDVLGGWGIAVSGWFLADVICSRLVGSRSSPAGNVGST